MYYSYILQNFFLFYKYTNITRKARVFESDKNYFNEWIVPEYDSDI